MIVKVTHLNTGETTDLKGTPEEVAKQAVALFPWARRHPSNADYNKNDVRHVLARLGASQNLQVEVEES